jgi:hypothetical protein
MPSMLSSEILSITVASGLTDSDLFDGAHIQDCSSVVFYGPAALLETPTFQVSNDGGVTWKTWQQGDTAPGDAAPPLAGKARTYFDLPGVRALRIHLGGAAAADRTWTISRLYVAD